MVLTFVEIKLALPDGLQLKNVPKKTLCSPKVSTIGYRLMCRFHSTVVHYELRKLPHLSNIEYIMRLDDDSILTSPIGYDLFKLMKVNKKLYGSASLTVDDPICVAGLWEHARIFMNQSRLHVNLSDVFFSEWKDGDVFYNNFEVSHVSVWQHPVWREFMSYIDDTQGIFKYRWGDAPIHGLGMSMILRKDQVHIFSDIGYTHEPFIRQSPSGLPHPQSGFLSNLDCNYFDGWHCHATNKRNFSISRLGTESIFKIGLDYISQENGVMFTFAHPGRESHLGELFRVIAIISK